MQVDLSMAWGLGHSGLTWQSRAQRPPIILRNASSLDQSSTKGKAETPNTMTKHYYGFEVSHLGISWRLGRNT